MSFSYRIHRAEAPIKHVSVDLAPEDIEFIANILSSEFPAFVGIPETTTGKMVDLWQEVSKG